MRNITTTALLLLLYIVTPTQAQVTGGQLFDNTKIHEIKVTSLYESLLDTLSKNYVMSFGIGQIQTRKIPYAIALITIDGTTLDTIGIRHKGFNSWWSSVKKPIKIDINKYKDQRYDGLSKFNLHNGSGDPSFIRESISYTILRSLGIPAPRTAYAKVYVDDTYLGLYHLVEQIDNTFLDRNYGNHEGNLYVQQNKGSGGFGLQWISDNQEDYYSSVELENHEKENDWSSFINFLDVLNNTSDATFKDEIRGVFDLDEYLQILAFDVAINNLDWYGNSGRNFYIAEVDGKFHWLPWDYNLSWREDATPIDINADEYPVLINRVLKDSQLHSRFLKKYCNLLPYFESSTFESMVDSEVTLITDLLKTDPYMDYSHEAFETNISQTWEGKIGLKEFADKRYTEITTALQSFDIDCSVITDIPEPSANIVQIYPVPATEVIHVKFTQSQKVGHLVLTNSVGQIVDRLELTSTGDVSISHLPDGVYILKVSVSNRIYSEKVVIHKGN